MTHRSCKMLQTNPWVSMMNTENAKVYTSHVLMVNYQKKKFYFLFTTLIPTQFLVKNASQKDKQNTDVKNLSLPNNFDYNKLEFLAPSTLSKPTYKIKSISLFCSVELQEQTIYKGISHSIA